MDRKSGESSKSILQVLGIAGLVCIFLIILHKGYSDISLLARIHSGAEFWSALVRYLLANLAS